MPPPQILILVPIKVVIAIFGQTIKVRFLSCITLVKKNLHKKFANLHFLYLPYLFSRMLVETSFFGLICSLIWRLFNHCLNNLHIKEHKVKTLEWCCILKLQCGKYGIMYRNDFIIIQKTNMD